jgi:hypothetical protein
MTLYEQFWCVESSGLHKTAGKMAQGAQSIKFNLKVLRIEFLTETAHRHSSLKPTLFHSVQENVRFLLLE